VLGETRNDAQGGAHWAAGRAESRALERVPRRDRVHSRCRRLRRLPDATLLTSSPRACLASMPSRRQRSTYRPHGSVAACGATTVSPRLARSERARTLAPGTATTHKRLRANVDQCRTRPARCKRRIQSVLADTYTSACSPERMACASKPDGRNVANSTCPPWPSLVAPKALAHSGPSSWRAASWLRRFRPRGAVRLSGGSMPARGSGPRRRCDRMGGLPLCDRAGGRLGALRCRGTGMGARVGQKKRGTHWAPLTSRKGGPVNGPAVPQSSSSRPSPRHPRPGPGAPRKPW
jgi:hypothetical protein